MIRRPEQILPYCVIRNVHRGGIKVFGKPKNPGIPNGPMPSGSGPMLVGPGPVISQGPMNAPNYGTSSNFRNSFTSVAPPLGPSGPSSGGQLNGPIPGSSGPFWAPSVSQQNGPNGGPPGSSSGGQINGQNPGP